MFSTARALLHRHGLHPRRWLRGLLAYPRYLGYVRPRLLTCSEDEYVARRQVVAAGWACRRLQVPLARRILALSPHPDDESFGAGGLLWAHRHLAAIHLITLCQGDRGGSLGSGPPESQAERRQMAELRKAELHKTATALNAASCQFFEYPDGAIPADETAVRRLRDAVDRIGPDLVLLPWFLDNLPDHRQTNRLYVQACRHLGCMVLAYEVWSLLEPNAVLDITPFLDAKLSLIRHYETQLRTVDYVSYALGLARVRAYHHPIQERRAGAAEAFIALPNADYCELAAPLVDPR
jgi:LmbE family N-acetylglucosaminyl deacetylase